MFLWSGFWLVLIRFTLYLFFPNKSNIIVILKTKKSNFKFYFPSFQIGLQTLNSNNVFLAFSYRWGHSKEVFCQVWRKIFPNLWKGTCQNQHILFRWVVFWCNIQKTISAAKEGEMTMSLFKLLVIILKRGLFSLLYCT